MTLILKDIDDPRDALSKARRYELAKFAEANGVKEIDPNMPAELMRRILRQKGLTRIKIPPRILGQPNQPHANSVGVEAGVQPRGIEADAVADLARQYAQQRTGGALLDEKSSTDKPVNDMTFNELHAECRAKSLKRDRGMNTEQLRELVRQGRGENAA